MGGSHQLNVRLPSEPLLLRAETRLCRPHSAKWFSVIFKRRTAKMQIAEPAQGAGVGGERQASSSGSFFAFVSRFIRLVKE